MTVARPAAVAADGNIKVAFAATVTPTAPAAAQLTAGTDMSFYLTAAGLKPNVDQQEIVDDRLADAQTFQAPGRYKYDLGEIEYVFNPASAPDNAAQVALPRGTTGYLVVRFGLPVDTAWAAAQKVDVWPVTFGAPMKQPPEANTVLKIKQRVFTTGAVQLDVAVA